MGQGALPWFHFYVADWLLDTAHMTAEQEGCYIRLLAYQWRDGGIPDDAERLARICRLDTDYFADMVWPALEECFDLDDDGMLTNARLERERTDQDRYRLQQSKKGKKSGRVRRSLARTSNHGSTVVEPELNNSSTGVEPEANEKEIRERSKAPYKRTGLESLFQEPEPDPALRNPRSLSIPKDRDVLAETVYGWLLEYYPERRPGAGAPPELKVWSATIPDFLEKAAALKRELETADYGTNGHPVRWHDLDKHTQRGKIATSLNLMKRVAGA